MCNRVYTIYRYAHIMINTKFLISDYEKVEQMGVALLYVNYKYYCNGWFKFEFTDR